MFELTMDISQCKKKFSGAYLQAVASVAGFGTSQPDPDDDSVDWTLYRRGGKGTKSSPRLELQIKCTSRDLIHDNSIHFPLDIKNYNDLRTENLTVPRILVVVTVPERMEDWVEQSDDNMLIRHCGYWASLRGLPATENTHTVTVVIPMSQQFTVQSLKEIMQRIANEEYP